MTKADFEQYSTGFAVEAISGGRQAVIRDCRGLPSVMVRIPKFYLDQVIDGAPHIPHPAFVVDGKERSEIWISKYLNVLRDGLAYSPPAQDPVIDVEFDDAMKACSDKGPGWHLMTNAEWAAIALWCRKAGKMPRGNNMDANDLTCPWEYGVKATEDPEEYRTLTGTGPDSWNHDGSPWGIADLNGNIWEWLDGLKLINGRIFVHENNNYGTGNIEGCTDGWIDTGLYFDNTEPGDDNQAFHRVAGHPIISDTRENITYTGGDEGKLHGVSCMPFEELEAKPGVEVPELFKYLALYPADPGDHGRDGLLVRNYGERVGLRGGRWQWGEEAGVFCLALGYQHRGPDSRIGFRVAYDSQA